MKLLLWKGVIIMCAAKFKHLTFNDRLSIEKGLNNNLSFKSIALEIGKNCSTISKEIRLNCYSSTSFALNSQFNPCVHRTSCTKIKICKQCKFKRDKLCRTCRDCISNCSDYEELHCAKLLKPPYVCNGCDDFKKCTLRKLFYDSSKAQKKYTEKKTESRSGIIINEDDIKRLNNLLIPLIKEQNQSIHHVYIHHKDEIMFSEKTLYKIIDSGCLQVRNIDLQLKVRRRSRKKKSICKIDSKCRIGRTFDDYKKYINNHSDIPVVQMDSVIGRKGGKVLLTLHFTNCNFMLAYIRNYNDSKSVIDIFENLYRVLGAEIFKKLFPVILTDNGSEFSNPNAIECSKDGCERTKIFYCNPSSPFEKGSCEVNHEFIRKISPKGTSMDSLTQENVNIMMSHINSYGRNKLNGKSPLDLFLQLYGEDVLDRLNIKKIHPDKINLSTNLLCKEEH